MLVFFGVVKGLEELVVCDDSFDEVAPGGIGSLYVCAGSKSVRHILPEGVITRAVLWNCECGLHGG